ncbi:MAG: transglutaminase family protein [Candidatus Omnitrophica bacterium]|nr:transglutaminase family protein [Candidatus Omnitrophota bacterium]
MDLKQIPYLLQLLEDDSEVVRAEVVKALKSYGPELTAEVDKLQIDLSPESRKVLLAILAVHRREWLRRVWPDWYKAGDEYASLEAAMGLIAEFQNAGREAPILSVLLDRLAQEYRTLHHSSDDPLVLADFLFGGKKIGGAPEDDYYNPHHSNMVYAIEHKRGLPITLAGVYMLVGARLGMSVTGCALPGHFLARAEYAGRSFYVDGFHGGRVLSAKAVLDRYASSGSANVQEMLKTPADVKMIVRRVLTNLAYAYEKREDQDNSRFMADLLRDAEKFSGGVPDYFPD